MSLIERFDKCVEDLADIAKVEEQLSYEDHLRVLIKSNKNKRFVPLSALKTEYFDSDSGGLIASLSDLIFGVRWRALMAMATKATEVYDQYLQNKGDVEELVGLFPDSVNYDLIRFLAPTIIIRCNWSDAVSKWMIYVDLRFLGGKIHTRETFTNTTFDKFCILEEINDSYIIVNDFLKEVKGISHTLMDRLQISAIKYNLPGFDSISVSRGGEIIFLALTNEGVGAITFGGYRELERTSVGPMDTIIVLEVGNKFYNIMDVLCYDSLNLYELSYISRREYFNKVRWDMLMTTALVDIYDKYRKEDKLRFSDEIEGGKVLFPLKLNDLIYQMGIMVGVDPETRKGLLISLICGLQSRVSIVSGTRVFEWEIGEKLEERGVMIVYKKQPFHPSSVVQIARNFPKTLSFRVLRWISKRIKFVERFENEGDKKPWQKKWAHEMMRFTHRRWLTADLREFGGSVVEVEITNDYLGACLHVLEYIYNTYRLEGRGKTGKLVSKVLEPKMIVENLGLGVSAIYYGGKDGKTVTFGYEMVDLIFLAHEYKMRMYDSRDIHIVGGYTGELAGYQMNGVD